MDVQIDDHEENNNINQMHNFNDVISQRNNTVYQEMHREIERELKKKEPLSTNKKESGLDDDLDADFLHKDSDKGEESPQHRTTGPTLEGGFHVVESTGYHGNAGNDNSYMDRSGISHH